MAIKRYDSEKDSVIYNAFKPGLLHRATGSNVGLADSLEVFSIYAQASSGSSEKARTLIQFPMSDISSDRTAGSIPASGSVNFFLKLFNVKHGFTLPRNYDMAVLPISRSWTEGTGTDLSAYTDSGSVNWVSATDTQMWTSAGGDYHTTSYVAGTTLPSYTASFTSGEENIEIDITSLTEEWLAAGATDALQNYGVGLMMSGTYETGSQSYYTKRFSARGTEYFFQKPVIEARWDSSIKDNRGNFWVSSSLASAADNLNTIYLYNHVRGRLTNLPDVGTGSVYVQIWDDAQSGSVLTTPPVTGGFVETGIYSASFALNTTSSYVYDRWLGALLTPTFHTASIKMTSLYASNTNPTPSYVVSIPDLKPKYDVDENARFRLFVREKNWCPNIYTKATQEIEPFIVENLFFRVKRVPDDLVVIDYGTGSLNHTRLSYDVSGSYFDLEMSLFERGYMYEVSFIFSDSSIYRESKNRFRFRVE